LFFLILNIFVWSAIYIQNHQKLKVSFLDIGQGDSIYIQAPNGNNILIDGGFDRKVLSALGSVMPFASRKIDIVLATHPDADHIGGLPYVFDDYDISAFIDNGAIGETKVWKTLEEKVVKENSPEGQAQRVQAKEGVRIILDEKNNVIFDVLSPYMNVNKLSDTNTGSIVGKLTYGSSSFMLTGDAPIAVEQNLVKKYGNSLESDVLKAGHHGSKTSSSEIFLKAVAPQFAIISASAKNMYGHPHKEVVDLLSKFGIKILKTGEEGTTKCESSGGEVVCK